MLIYIWVGHQNGGGILVFQPAEMFVQELVPVKKKINKTKLCMIAPSSQVDSHHKRLVIRRAFPCYDVHMLLFNGFFTYFLILHFISTYFLVLHLKFIPSHFFQ